MFFSVVVNRVDKAPAVHTTVLETCACNTRAKQKRRIVKVNFFMRLVFDQFGLICQITEDEDTKLFLKTIVMFIIY